MDFISIPINLVDHCYPNNVKTRSFLDFNKNYLKNNKSQIQPRATLIMSVLMLVSLDSRSWPSDDAINWFKKKSDSSSYPLKILTYKDTGKLMSSFAKFVAHEFKLSECHGHNVRLVLTGFHEPDLATELYMNYNVPVNVLFRTPEVDDSWFDAFDPILGVTMSGWQCLGRETDDDVEVIAYAVDFMNGLSRDFQSYVEGLRDMPTVVQMGENLEIEENNDIYTSIMDTFGDNVQTIEPVLDAMLEQLCGTDEDQPDDDNDRWMLSIVEDGDKALEYTFSLKCSTEAKASYTRRVTRVAKSFATSFWCDYTTEHITTTDRILTACLIDNLLANADSILTDMSTEQFSICLNAKFIASRRWQSTTNGTIAVADVFSDRHIAQSLFRLEIRNCCERFMAVNHILDLMAVGDGNGEVVYSRSHVEHLEPHLLSQRLLDYASRHYRYEVRYFALTDTLVFRFTDGKPGQLVEKFYKHRLVGPKNFREFHSELFRTTECFRLG